MKRAFGACVALFLLAACAAPPVPTRQATAAIAAATSLPSQTYASATAPTPTVVPTGLYVDAARSMGKVSRFALGTNHGPWAFLNPEVMPQFLESGISLIRFPGGNWGDRNNLEPWQVDTFIALARQINAEPLISARLPGGTPEQAAALLRYTEQQGDKVRYWSIGNEPNLYKNYDTAQFNADWRKFALALKAVDPSIQLVGPDTSQYTGSPTTDPKDKEGKDWLREFLKANGDLVDVVAVHRYPFPAQMNTRPTRAELFANTAQWDSIAINLRTAVREDTGRDLPIAITEFNSSWVGTMGGEAGTDTFCNALWLGDVVGRLIRQRVDMLAHFTLVSDGSIGGYGLFTRDEARPSYYAFRMYRDFGDELVHAQSDLPLVSIYAARKGDALSLVVVNLNDQVVTRPIVLDHFAASGKAQVTLFDEQHKAERVPDLTVWNTLDYAIPPTSMTFMLIPGKVTGF